MSEFISLTFGKISGRHGNVVATVSKSTGKTHLRIYNPPSNPRTPKQMAVREKFSMVNKEMRPFRALFKITFGGNDGVRKAISLVFRTAIAGEYKTYKIDYTKLIISEGALNTACTPSATKTAANTIKVEWDYTEDFYGINPNDSVNLIFYNEITKELLFKQSVSLRNIETVDNTMPEVWIGSKIHCYIYFTTADGKTNSISQYISEVQL